MDKKLILKSGKEYKGRSFGADKSAAGELVFATGMVGYVESLTDPSYRGQILVMTYPLLGNYGVPDKSNWESDKIQVAGLIVSSYIDTPSHHASLKSLGKWLRDENIPALEIRDTRALAINLRQKGSLPGKIVINKNIRFEDPNLSNLVAEVSVKRPKIYGKGSKTVVVLDCGIKRNIIRELVERKVKVILAPWNFDPFAEKIKF